MKVKQLFESFRTFVNEELDPERKARIEKTIQRYNSEDQGEFSNIKHNYHFIKTARPFTRSGNFSYFKNNPEALYNIMKKTPPMVNNKIVKAIGQGVYSTAFLLDNDHVFKYFEDTDAKEWLSDLNRRAFTGDLKPSELMVHDVGTVVVAGGAEFSYAEMNRVFPTKNLSLPEKLKLQDIIKKTEDYIGSKLKNKDIGRIDLSIKDAISFYKKKYAEYLDADKENPLEFYGNPKEALSIMKVMLDFASRYGYPHDLHLGNIGYIESLNGDKKFIIFDPMFDEKDKERVPMTLIKHNKGEK